MIVPLALLGVGFFLIGPNIGKALPGGPPQTEKTVIVTPSDATPDSVAPPVEGSSDADNSDSAPSTHYPAPDVKVSVSRGYTFHARDYSDRYSNGRKRSRRYRHSRHHSSTTAPTENTGASPGASDSGGSGGNQGVGLMNIVHESNA